MTNDNQSCGLPLPTIRRYPVYLRAIREMIDGGEDYISSAVLARKLGIDPVSVRKDLAMSGISGRPRLGYPANELLKAIVSALGWDNTTDALLIGAGSLGQALLGYGGFKTQGLSIVLAFDTDKKKVGKEIHGVKVRGTEELKKLVRRMKIHLGIITVPASCAQACADLLVDAGIVGIWNFSPVRLSVPSSVTVQDVDLAQSLAVLSHSISTMSNIPI